MIYEPVKYAAVPDKQNKEYVEAEVPPEGTSGSYINAPKYMYVEASDHPEVNKYQDVVVIADTEVHEYLDSDSSFLSEVTEDHEVIVARAKN